ncbi:hypothetical protein [Hyphobacterium sp.]|uniref:hypothetical protein n=1 Tax=Hyphobacterium sp. TaxID=2004662 RepID=UPI003747994F
MSDPNKPDDARPSRADVDDVADAAIGVDTRIFRTIWDTFIHTPRVVEAAFAGDREKYVPVIRLFLVLFGLQFVFMALVELPNGMTLQALEVNENTETMNEWLMTAPDCQVMFSQMPDPGSLSADALEVLRSNAMAECRANVDQTLGRLASFTTMPLTFLSTLPYLLLLKLFYMRRSLFGHLLVYLSATNASYILIFPFFGLFFLFRDASIFWAGFGISLIWYFVAIGRLMFRFYSTNRLLVGLQIFAQVMVTPIMFVLIAIAQLALVHFALQIGHDLSILELMRMS